MFLVSCELFLWHITDIVGSNAVGNSHPSAPVWEVMAFGQWCSSTSSILQVFWMDCSPQGVSFLFEMLQSSGGRFSLSWLNMFRCLMSAALNTRMPSDLYVPTILGCLGQQSVWACLDLGCQTEGWDCGCSLCGARSCTQWCLGNCSNSGFSMNLRLPIL